MTRDEALRVLGLKEDADEAGVKLAYKEMAQILHPDKFGDNKKLQERATEQFKQVNLAREVLLGGKGAGGARGRGRGSAGTSGRTGTTGSTGSSSAHHDTGFDRAATLKARLVGIAAARVQLVAQLDADKDSRRIGLILIAGGVIGALIGRASAVGAIASTAFIWGVVQAISTQARIRIITSHLKDLDQQRKAYTKELEEM
jgi:hypothetical protein